MEELQRVLGERIRALRKKLGITQQELADKVGFSALQIVSEIERGGRDVKAWELVRIAEALRTEVRLLISPDEPIPARVLWRDYPKEGAAALEASFLTRCRQYHDLEKLLGITPMRELPAVNLNPKTSSDLDTRRAAKDVAKALDLGGRPAASLAAVLEGDYAVKVWYEDLGGVGSAASAAGDFGCGVLMHSKQAPWRRNFSLAHELFHLVTRETITTESVGDDQPLASRVERMADLFAASLLLPADVLEVEILARIREDKISYGDLVDLAREFSVSTEALIWRMVDCHRGFKVEQAKAVLGDPAFRALDRSTMSAYWQEPPSLSERFVRLVCLAYRRGQLSRARVAQLLGTSLIDLPMTLHSYGFEDTDDNQGETAIA